MVKSRLYEQVLERGWNAERQAFGYGRCKAVARAAPSARSRSPLIDASFPTAVLRDETAA
jgi:hypothetical protein